MKMVEKEYTIIIGGKEVGKYISCKYYQEFEKPFFKMFPQYKDVIHFFNHITCIISDVDIQGYSDFIMDGDNRFELTYSSVNIRNEKSYKRKKYAKPKSIN